MTIYEIPSNQSVMISDVITPLPRMNIMALLAFTSVRIVLVALVDITD